MKKYYFGRLGFPSVCVVIVLASMSSIQCHTSPRYEMHIGQPFYSLQQPSYARFYGQDMIRNMTGRSYVVQGVYTAPDSVFVEFPTLRLFHDDVGLKYIPLFTELEAADGDLVEVTGKVQQIEVSLKETGFVQKKEILIPEEARIVRTSSRLKKSAQIEYQQIREMLQREITPKGSRLTLLEIPRWFVVWSESNGSFIVSARQTDLMYQAEIDLVFDGQTFILKEAYAVEWFKGE